MKKLAIFISGRGSNLESILKFEQAHLCCFKTVLVISDQPKANGLNVAKKYSVPGISCSKENFSSRELFDQHLHKMLVQNNIQFIALAGYMKLLSPWFVKQWEGKLINIHPSLLPSFPGLHAQKQAVHASAKQSGCTVFWVDEGVDTGKIIDQTIVPIYKMDTELSLSRRILKAEHRLYPEVIEKIALKKITFSDR